MKQRTLMTNRARSLRQAMSEPEVMLWTHLRGRRGDKPTFRRQHPIESVIVDFYCPSARLVIEVDGATHWSDEKRRRDAARDRWLESKGLRVLRIAAADVYRDLSGVAEGVVGYALELKGRV